MSGHSLCSPSAAARWMQCPGSVPLTQGLDDPGSKFSREGTDAHQLAAECLTRGVDADDEEVLTITREDGKSFTPDDDMRGYIQVYVDAVRNSSEGCLLLVEQRVDPSAITGGDNSGTADAIIFDTARASLEIWDLKFGRGQIVLARDNPQLMIYALGALASFDLIMKAEMFKLVINQPRRDHVSEFEISREDLLEFGEEVAAANVKVAEAMRQPTNADALASYLAPSESACRWCLFKSRCPALGHEVERVVEESALPEPDKLALIEGWCSATRKTILETITEGGEVPGWKMVSGQRGHRKWADDTAAEKLCRKLRLRVDGCYTRRVKSPTGMERLLRAQSAKWEQFQPLITQTDPLPILVAEDDKRLALSPVIDDFTDLTTQEEIQTR